MANDSKYGRIYPEAAVAPALKLLGRLVEGEVVSRDEAASAALDVLVYGFPPAEPLFLLRGQDTIAPEAVRYYAKLIDDPGVGIDADHIRAFADRMEAWEPRKLPD